jgi:phospholipase C
VVRGDYHAAAMIITYAENGGIWDHVAPQKSIAGGPARGVPTIIISPFAKRHFVDHTTQPRF